MQRTWVHRFLQPVIVASLMACLAISIVQVLQLLVPTWSGLYLTLVVFVTALEAPAANRLVRRYRLSGRERLSFRAGEWILILIALKAGSYTNRGPDALLADLARLSSGLEHLVTVEYVVAIALTLMTWLAAGDIANDLDELAQPDVGLPIDRESIQSRLLGQFFWGGMILLVAAGVARIGVAQLLDLSHPSVPGIILNALLYFVLGLVLLSQARLTALEARWRTQDTPTETDIGNRWSRASLIFIGLVAVVALLLPTSYSYGLLETLGLVLGTIMQAVYFVLGLILLIFSLPFMFLFSLLRGDATAERQAPPALPQFTPPAPAESGGPSLWALLRSLLFWALLIGITVYALRSYVGYREALLGRLQTVPWLRRLWHFVSGLWRRVRSTASSMTEPLRRRLAQVAPSQIDLPDAGRWRWRRLSSMSPRERIQYYYLSVVHRGEKVGRPRRRSETPQEYSHSLRAQKPEVEPDLSELTDAFVEARYSRHTVTDEQAGLLRQSWNRIKRVLRS